MFKTFLSYYKPYKFDINYETKVGNSKNLTGEVLLSDKFSEGEHIEIQDLNDSIQKENERVSMKIDNIYIMKHIEIPTTIVECGFLSNPEEEKIAVNA